MQALAQRLERGGAQTFSGVATSAHPFFAALLQKKFSQRPIVFVTENLKAQESSQQDLETWLGDSPLYFPAWEILPHEGKLPPADVISDRLQTLVALAEKQKVESRKQKLVVTSVVALLQKTFAAADLKNRTRTLNRGDQAVPLDLIEWLEEQGYEPEAQVTQRGEIALRGGIVDIYPPTSPWPVRLEFFGDELESLREFDPLTQVSRGEITAVTLPPAGEIGILKREWERGPASGTASVSESKAALKKSGTVSASKLKRPEDRAPFATLLDHLPRETIFVLCEPDTLAVRAEEYALQVPAADPFHIQWSDFLVELHRRGFTSVELLDDEVIGAPAPVGVQALACSADTEDAADTLKRELQPGAPLFSSLDAFRPLAERAPEPQIAEMQRREFFQQLHRWLRQDYAVHVFCNNDGERQRFEEIWKELGFADSPKANVQSPKSSERDPLWTSDTGLWTHLGSLARGFICDEVKLVVVTDAEIFGRYKVLRPRRLKSPHASAVRSAMEIDFADGTLLTWLSEKKSPVFVIATANDISKLPPELLRKGRLDEIFFVDLPNPDERREIFRIHIAKRERNAALFDLERLALLSEGFNGAEIEEAVIASLFDAFSSEVELNTEIIANSLSETIPLSKTMSEELTRLRGWATGRARPATKPLETIENKHSRRKIEL